MVERYLAHRRVASARVLARRPETPGSRGDAAEIAFCYGPACHRPGRGRTGGLTWMVLRRLPGERLDLVWPTLPRREQRDAVTGLASALKILHGWGPPVVLREELPQAALTRPVTPEDIVGAGIVPLPSLRLLPLLSWLEEQPGMDSDLAGRVRTRIGELRPLVSDAEFEDGVMVHGDASFANVLWHQGRLTALLSAYPEVLRVTGCETWACGGVDISLAGVGSRLPASWLGDPDPRPGAAGGAAAVPASA